MNTPWSEVKKLAGDIILTRLLNIKPCHGDNDHEGLSCPDCGAAI